MSDGFGWISKTWKLNKDIKKYRDLGVSASVTMPFLPEGEPIEEDKPTWQETMFAPFGFGEQGKQIQARLQESIKSSPPAEWMATTRIPSPLSKENVPISQFVEDIAMIPMVGDIMPIGGLGLIKSSLGEPIKKTIKRIVPTLREEMPYLNKEISPAKARPILVHIANGLAKDIGGAKPTIAPVLSRTDLSKWGKIKEAFQNFSNRTYRTERMMLQMDDYAEDAGFQQAFIRPVEEATDEYIRGSDDIFMGLRNFLKEKNYQFHKLLTGTKYTLEGGQTLTPSQKIGVYLNTKNEDTLRHMVVGNKLNPEEIMKVVENLTPEEKAIGDWMLNVTNSRYDPIAKAYFQVTGKELAKVENYFPIKILRSDLTKDQLKWDYQKWLEWQSTKQYVEKWPISKVAKGFTKARSPRAVQPIELDAFSVFLRHVQETEHYKAFGPKIRDMQSLWENTNLKKAVIDRFGRPRWDVVKKWMNQVSETDPQRFMEQSERILSVFRRNAVAGALGVNIVTAMKQLPSFISGAAIEGEIPTLKGLVSYIGHPKETSKLIQKYAPQIYRRTFEREIAEQKLLRNVEQTIQGKLTPQEAFMWLTKTADKVAVAALWRGAFDDAMRGMNKRIAEAMGMDIKATITPEIAGKYATQVIQRTQPFFNIKDVPEFWRAGEAWKMLTIFTNQLNNYWNFYRFDIIGKAAAGRISKLEAIRRFGEAFVIPAFMIGWITRSRPAENVKEYLSDIGLMGTAVLPVLGSFISGGIRGFSQSSGFITTQAFSVLQSMAYNANKAEWDKVLMDIPEMAGFLAGYPVIQPKRTIEALWNIAEQKSNDWLELIWGQYQRKEATKGSAHKKLRGLLKK